MGAAICRAHEWGAKSVIGHLEWSRDKIDPKGFGMPGMRDRIAARLKTKPGSSTTTYTVGRGDTLWSIAASKLGDGARWREIAKLNHLANADRLTPGQKLKLPKK